MRIHKLVFATKKETIDYLKSIEGLGSNSAGTYFSPSGVYWKSNGESSRPTYEARRYKDGWSIHVEYCFFVGTFYAPESGRIDPEIFWQRFIDEEYETHEEALGKYMASK